MSELNKQEKKNLLGLPELLGEKMKRRERRFYNKNKEKLERLFENQVEITAKTFHIHVSGDLNKLDVEKLIKFAEENNKGSERNR